MRIENGEKGHTFYRFEKGGIRMPKSSKPKKEKVQKLTEEEYAAYIASLKDEGGVPSVQPKEESMEPQSE